MRVCLAVAKKDIFENNFIPIVDLFLVLLKHKQKHNMASKKFAKFRDYLSKENSQLPKDYTLPFLMKIMWEIVWNVEGDSW